MDEALRKNLLIIWNPNSQLFQWIYKGEREEKGKIR